MSPRMLPPLICEDGSTGMTATRFFFLTNFMPKFSINVDFPAPTSSHKDVHRKAVRYCEGTVERL